MAVPRKRERIADSAAPRSIRPGSPRGPGGGAGRVGCGRRALRARAGRPPRSRARGATPGGDGAVARAPPGHRARRPRVGRERRAGADDRTRARSPQTIELTDRVLASEEMQRMLQSTASSPELRRAVARQSAGLAEEVVGGARSSRRQSSTSVPAVESTLYAGIAIPRRRACLRRVRGPCHLRHGERSSRA